VGSAVGHIIECTNLQLKCSQCNEAHPANSYKCKAKPVPEEQKPHLVVPVKTQEEHIKIHPHQLNPLQYINQ